MKQLIDANIVDYSVLKVPSVVLKEIPVSEREAKFVLAARKEIESIVSGEDKRLLVVVGPCSIHDTNEALEYASRLKELSERVRDDYLIVMRAYFEKPRTKFGWPGLIEDPHLDGSNDTDDGIFQARQFLVDLAKLRIPAATEVLNIQTPQYISDLISYAVIGARNAESQDMRKMASGISMPVGIKNGVEGNLDVAIHGVAVAREKNCFRGINLEGLACNVRTSGNPYSHIVLRGGKNGGNYHAEDVAIAKKALCDAGLPAMIGVDCSHGNSSKDYRNQPGVFDELLRQRAAGNNNIMMLMLESYLEDGKQPFSENRAALKKGLSITDGCIGWEKTERLLLQKY